MPDLHNKEDELDEAFKRLETRVLRGAPIDYSHVRQLKTALKAHIEQECIRVLEAVSMAVVEPCEPECDPVRHALHQGSWNAHLKIEAEIERLQAQLAKKGGEKS